MPTNWKDVDARAVALSVALVDTVTPDDLARPTPCAGWSVADLLAHLIAHHRGFAAAVAGDGADPARWTVEPVGDDVVTRYRDAAERVVASFAAVTDLRQPVTVPDFGPNPIPAELAITAHAVDYLVHAWDVATALNRPFAPDADLVAAVLPVVRALPDDERRTEPGSPFAPALPPGPEASPMDQILRALGRNPT